MQKKIVSDTGPLISLEKLTEGYAFIRLLYDKIIIPPKVLEEVSEGSSQKYLRKYGIEDLIQVQTPTKPAQIPGLKNLHAGEAQAISLALELNLPLLIEEQQGRKIAAIAKIKFSGTAKQIVLAYEQKIISQKAAVKKLKGLLSNCRINKEIYEVLSRQMK